MNPTSTKAPGIQVDLFESAKGEIELRIIPVNGHGVRTFERLNFREGKTPVETSFKEYGELDIKPLDSKGMCLVVKPFSEPRKKPGPKPGSKPVSKIVKKKTTSKKVKPEASANGPT